MHRLSKVFPPVLAGIAVAILAATVLLPTASAQDRLPETTNPASETSDTFFPITFFQKVISRADGQRCPMHPSCSHYADTAIKKYGLLKGWILACDRLLRCGRDEVRLAPAIMVDGQRLAHDPLSANTFWWDPSSK